MAHARRRAASLAIGAAAGLVLSGCFGGDDPTAPEPEPSPSATAGITLSDISVSPLALGQRAGLYMCGTRIVASAPAGGIESDAFVVFDPGTGRGDVTEVRLPRPLRPNARWLLSSQCVEGGGEEGGAPVVSVAYQEMPLGPVAGSGVRAAYTLDGERLWMRTDLNRPATVVDDVLVLGATPEHPETAVDLRTGKTVATFDPAVQSRTVVAADRAVVRGLSGPPVLTTLTGERVATLEQASSYTADGPLLFGTTPAALPDPDASPTDEAGGLTDASPSPSPTQSEEPEPGTGLSQGQVQVYSLRTGRPLWEVSLAADPLGVPTVEPRTGIVVVTDIDGLAHGLDPTTGREQWRTPTELENPRVTAAAGMVMFDQVDDPFQKVVDARTGLPLPEPQEHIVDLHAQGALQVVDGFATVVPPKNLRSPPTTTEEPSG